MLNKYSRVRLLTDRFTDEGLCLGAIGYIIEVLDDDNYEVEFSDEQGITIATVVAHADELDTCEPDR